MKGVLKLLMAVLLLGSIAGLGYRQFVLIGPGTAIERMAAVHADHPEIDSHIDRYANALDTLGTPFEAMGRLSGVVERVENARTYTADVAGVELTPWRTIEENTPGAGLVDDLIREVTDLVRLADAAGSELGALGDAATAYRASRARCTEAPTDACVSQVASDARALADEIEVLQARLVPIDAALDASAAEVQAMREWLDGVTPDGAQQGFVVGGLRIAATMLETGMNVPSERVDAVVDGMSLDIERLREVASIEQSLRSAMFDRFGG